jgi:hypothetical protein
MRERKKERERERESDREERKYIKRTKRKKEREYRFTAPLTEAPATLDDSAIVFDASLLESLKKIKIERDREI